MRRRLPAIAIFLVAGAVVNVAVAWGCTVWLRVYPPRGVVERSVSSELAPTWIFLVRNRPGMRSTIARLRPTQADLEPWEVAYSRLKPEVPDWLGTYDVESLAEHRQNHVRLNEYGWPMRSLSCSALFHRPASPGRLTRSVKAGLALDRIDSRGAQDWYAARALPLRIIWAGFLTNSVLYAILLWSVWRYGTSWPRMPKRAVAYLITARRLERISRGLCPKCAYPMSESAVCTECGHKLPQRVRGVT